jgi:UDP-N-acetylmuramoylalanine--D-glutamate ligase
MNIAILGYDTEGSSSYNYYFNDHNHITVLDQNKTVIIPEGVDSVVGDAYLVDLDRFDLIVRTAGIPPHIIFDQNPLLTKDKVTSQINEFLAVSPTRNIIGVTGTKGKGTTSTLIANMLAASGLDVHLAGNIGIPALDLLPKLTSNSWVVLELSSFQLSDIRQSPHIGVCLMVVPEHLNWHSDFLDYTSSKAQMFAHQTPDDIAVFFADNSASQAIATSGHATAMPYFADPGASIVDGMVTIGGQAICATNELKLLGEHNWQNVCAAVTAAWQVTQDHRAIRSVLTSFTGLEHRLEYVADIEGVLYYDDSFGTTPETAIVAMQAFEQPKIMILGGSDKGSSYSLLASAVKSSAVRHVLLIGDQSNSIQAELEAVGYLDFSPGGTAMADIVVNARSVAHKGDVVLLSTACASFGMFKDYKDRGNQFQKTVLELQSPFSSS